MNRLRIAFFVSGNGTLFETITNRCLSGDIAADPVLVVASAHDIPALERAKRLNVPAVVIRRQDYTTGDDFSEAMTSVLEEFGVNLICLAGYLKLVPSKIVRAYAGRVLNIHPALLPAFGGKGMYGSRVHEAVLDYGARISGATVHVVDEEYDHGPIVLQRAVFVTNDDTAETLAHRVHAIEHDLYSDAVRLFAENRIQISGRHIIILPAKSA